MGIGGISVASLVIILLIVVLLFGTKRVRSIGKDLGEALKGFREGVQEAKKEDAASEATEQKSETEEPKD